ncbi:MAG: hypothetical protein V9E99_06335 [Microthrixaceae bacterium]|nr:hypothetical protein [Actinomycetota bacterium]MBP6729018.1 hypothetical protein [Microthrixaceae bacterium]HMS14109.1 hypothetical protein [Microthrixaceae bacterium]HMT23795.1 hypothetical protein [Microthrixaceae bacterium]HMT60883.1 hypothetical protein [Microthrixaceae bacterium]
MGRWRHMVEAMMVILVAGSVGVGALLVSAFANPNGELDASSAFLRLVVLWMSAIVAAAVAATIVSSGVG